jgi:hypothetical protein
LVPKIVHRLCNSAQVARSGKARDNLDLEIGEYRWLPYMLDFLRYSGDFDICTVRHERWFVDALNISERDALIEAANSRTSAAGAPRERDAQAWRLKICTWN